MKTAWLIFSALVLAAGRPAWPADYFTIRVTDEQTGRGVPLVELRTVHQVSYYTDSAGLVAFHEPGLMAKRVYFQVRSHGYEYPADGFGLRGTALQTTPGASATLKIRRINVAERLYRITGAGIYRDSVLLGQRAPIAESLLNAQVLGQDSTQPAIYRGKIYWFWGDTLQLKYPLGNFRTSGAVSELPGRGGLDPAAGINLRYFTGRDGFCKAMCPLEGKEGMVWIDGVLTVSDPSGRERMVTHYSRMKSLGEMLEHGAAVFNDEEQVFERNVTFQRDERWRCPHGQPVRHRDGQTDFFYFGIPCANVRVKADLEAVLTPKQYEAWSCLADGSPTDAKQARLQRDSDGRLVYRWTTKAPPVGPAEERRLVEARRMEPSETWFQPADVQTGKVVQLHGGSVRWNPWRKRWVLIAVEQGGTSFLGEVWYAEAPGPTGPWRRARKIVTHDRYTFYNPVHHAFFDQEGGRLIYFEGTYANTFSGNPEATPRYDYNQIMYRLDLSDPRLKEVQEQAEPKRDGTR